MKEKQTPLMRQYSQIKNKYPDTILLFRLGDFYETFMEDAELTAKACGITLTKRNNGAGADMPLAGFPYHQLDAYLPKLVRAGHRVAVCEQLEDPKNSRGIVKRGVIEVVTPGVTLYDKLLDQKRNNYIVAIYLRTEKTGLKNVGLAGADVSTGEFFTAEFPIIQLKEVLETLSPSEIVCSKSQKNDINRILEDISFDPSLTKLEDWLFDTEFAREALLGQFKTSNLKGFGVDDYTIGIAAAGAILHYFKETQNSQISHINRISRLNVLDFMLLDAATRRNLEISYSSFDGGKAGSLISILDKTLTPMGGRLLVKWINRPLIKFDAIQKRLEAVEAFFNSQTELNQVRGMLSKISDLERIISKICTARANPRDLIALKTSLNVLPELKQTLNSISGESLQTLSNGLDELKNVVDFIDKALIAEPSVQLGNGNVFQDGYSEELDKYTQAKKFGKNWLSEYQETERKRSGISSLKVGFNTVFGYYIEITKAHKNNIPEDYDRKQTLTNAERYITPELKEFEEKILQAEERIASLESELFSELRMKIALFTEAIQLNSQRLAALDCLQSFAQTAIDYNYTKPEVDESEALEIFEGRHPVVERLLEVGEKYQSNSTYMDTDKEQVHIITGPNMSGKSCYLRQTALIVLLGQIGSYVPASKARFGIVDRIFTRVGAQDNITAGESTFLVEMQEAANILNNATRKSLILLDEVGRGTATFDGISIAWAIAEYIHDFIYAKTLFATHYHELNDLATRYDRISNFQVKVIESGNNIIFTHQVQPGAADHSFGIYVAQLAGLPKEIINRADEIMKTLEETTQNDSKNIAEINSKTVEVKHIKSKKIEPQQNQMSIFEFRDDELRERIKQLNLNDITPLQALKILAEFQILIKE